MCTKAKECLCPQRHIIDVTGCRNVLSLNSYEWGLRKPGKRTLKYNQWMQAKE